MLMKLKHINIWPNAILLYNMFLEFQAQIFKPSPPDIGIPYGIIVAAKDSSGFNIAEWSSPVAVGLITRRSGFKSLLRNQ